MPKVFISYRREESQDITGRIYDRLVESFSAANVFKDVDNIPLGSDFRRILDDAIAQASAVLVVIGPKWLCSLDADGARRLDNPTDFVRLEVEAALRKELPIVPVLVGHARMPTADELPQSLQELPYRHGLSVRPDPDFNHDVERLTSALDQWVDRSASSTKPMTTQLLSEIACQQEVARMDREWQDERVKWMPLVPRIVSVGFSLLGACLGFLLLIVCANWPNVSCFLAFPLGICCVWLGIGIYHFNKASKYEAAEEAYRQRRESALARIAH